MILITFFAILLYIPAGLFSISGLYVSLIAILFAKYNGHSLILLLLGLTFSLLFFVSSLLFTSTYSFLTLYAIAILPLASTIKLSKTEKTINYLMIASFVVLLVFIIPLDVNASTWFDIFYDRNVFGLIMLPFFFAISRRYKFGFIVSILLAIMLGSRNVLLAVLIERFLSNLWVFNYIYRKLPTTSNVLSILLPILALVSLFVFSSSISFEYDREYFSIFDASNLARATGMMDALIFLYNNPSVLIFGNGWDEYIVVDAIHAHNDFIRFIIKHGLFVLVYFLWFIFRAYRVYRIDGAIIVSYVIFSGILGGIGWGVGFYWLIISMYLFSENGFIHKRKYE